MTEVFIKNQLIAGSILAGIGLILLITFLCCKFKGGFSLFYLVPGLFIPIGAILIGFSFLNIYDLLYAQPNRPEIMMGAIFTVIGICLFFFIWGVIRIYSLSRIYWLYELLPVALFITGVVLMGCSSINQGYLVENEAYLIDSYVLLGVGVGLFALGLPIFAVYSLPAFYNLFAIIPVALLIPSMILGGLAFKSKVGGPNPSPSPPDFVVNPGETAHYQATTTVPHVTGLYINSYINGNFDVKFAANSGSYDSSVVPLVYEVSTVEVSAGNARQDYIKIVNTTLSPIILQFTANWTSFIRY